MCIYNGIQAKQQMQKEFEVALQKLRGKDANIIKEAAEIQVQNLRHPFSLSWQCNILILTIDSLSWQNYIEELDKLPKVNLIHLFQGRYLRFVTVSRYSSY